MEVRSNNDGGGGGRPREVPCPHCGRPRRALVLHGTGRNGEPREFVAPAYEPCGCDGARRARELEEAAREARAQAEEILRSAGTASAAHVPKRFADAEDPRAAPMVERALREGRGAWLYGAVGTGKTYLACAAAREAGRRGTRAVFTSSISMLDAVKRMYDREAGGGEAEALRPYVECALLVLDDVGKEKPTDWAVQQLFRVVDARWLEMRPVVLTSQYGPEQLRRRLSKGEAGTADAVVSRLLDMCEPLRLDGPDRRRAK